MAAMPGRRVLPASRSPARGEYLHNTGQLTTDTSMCGPDLQKRQAVTNQMSFHLTAVETLPQLFLFVQLLLWSQYG